MKKTIVMCGPFNTRSGYGDHARSIYYSLATQSDKYDIKVLDVRWGDTPRNHLNSNIPQEADLLSKFVTPEQIKQQPDIYIDVRIPNEFMNMGKVNIGITAGIETTMVSSAWIEGVNRMDMTIVPSQHSRDSFINTKYDKVQDIPGSNPPQQKKIGELKVEKPIKVLHEGMDPNVFKKLNKKEIDQTFQNKINNIVKRPSLLFVGQWTQGGMGNDRKDISRLIKLFIETYGNKPHPPGLLLKTNGATLSHLDEVETKRKIQHVIDLFPKDISIPPIYLLHARLTETELNQLYNHEKIVGLVSFTHGEGFGRPLLEATFAGLPVCASNWSGHLDFLPKEKSCLVNGSMGKVPGEVVWENIIMEQSQWFTVDDMDAYEALRSIYNEKGTKWNRLAEELRLENIEKFSMDKMTEKLLSMVEEYASKVPQPMQIKLPKLATV